MHMHVWRVELPDGCYTLIQESGEEEAEGSWTTCVRNKTWTKVQKRLTLLMKAGTGALTYSLFEIYATIYVMFVHLRFRIWIETLDVWSLGTYALISILGR